MEQQPRPQEMNQEQVINILKFIDAAHKEEPSSQESYDSQKARELWETSTSLVKLTREEILL